MIDKDWPPSFCLLRKQKVKSGNIAQIYCGLCLSIKTTEKHSYSICSTATASMLTAALSTDIISLSVSFFGVKMAVNCDTFKQCYMVDKAD